jgi:hypothetical protein
MNKILLLLVIIGWSQSVFGQLTEFDRWAARVNWDAETPWAEYIVRAPGRMGPNALPLPIQRAPRLDSNWRLEWIGEFHVAPGDYTQNPFIFIRVPLAPGRVALDLTWRPMEWFQTSEAVRDFRFARNENGRGNSPGDVWITTVAQLLQQENNRSGLDLTLNVAVKTTAGKNLENARHTNTPGYIFDLHAGKSWSRPGSFVERYRLFGSSGLWVWQEGLAQQNDAYIWGLRAELEHGPWQWGLGTTGYVGWIDNGDRPYAVRTDLQYQNGRWLALVGYQHAFRDLTMHLWRVGFGLQLPKRN